MAIQQIIQAIKKYDTIIIHRHVRPDPDAYGSQGALQELIQQSFPEKKVYVVGEEPDESLYFLNTMDDIKDDVYDGALVIVCDTANTDRISDTRYNSGAQLIKIDHHPNEDAYGDLIWVDTTASSSSELIYELYLHGRDQGFIMNTEAARLLYAGIVGDTGRFLFPNTSTDTFQYVADLITYPFERSEIYNHLYRTKENVARLQGYILQHYELKPSGMSSIKLTKDTLDKANVSSVETGQLVNVLSDIEGIKAWVMFIEEENSIRVRLRSKGPVINTIAAKYNGGGHPMASGAEVSDWEEAEAVIDDLDKVCAAYE
ncbi:MAG TPA: bifunctional oligoribonuclease/PAP phosphatase NrnA [Virgibacillus sp.]|nr:bifunctional oligoribonuclease/PAP phosphatase NrnA [Virgibacillus sp.]